MPRFKLNVKGLLKRKPRVKTKQVFESATSKVLAPGDEEKEASLQRNDITADEIRQLRDDLSNQMTLRGGDEASKIVPPGLLRKSIKNLDTSNSKQVGGGLLGAAGGGLLGAGAGALTMALAKGKPAAKWGLLGGIPSGLVGYAYGANKVRDQQLLSVLEEHLGPGAGIKKAAVEPLFAEFLRNQADEAATNNFKMKTFLEDINELEKGRGRGLNATEKMLVAKRVFKDTKKTGRMPPRHMADAWVKGPPKPPKYKPGMGRLGKGLLGAAGGLAALSALGIGAAHYWPRDKDSPRKD